FRLNKENVKRKQVIVMMIGFTFPLMQGTITEIILPHFYNHSSIPLASTSMTFFSVAILIALRKYKLFSINDSLKTRTVLEAMTDILIVLSADKKIQFINREGELALGVSQYEKNDLKVEDFFMCNAQGKDNFCENVFVPVLAGKKVANYHTEIRTRSGRKISVLVSATSYKAGMFESQVLLLIHDISELIQTEKQLAVREEQLKDKTEELNAFFYRTTHDLKGPVASIIGLTKLIKKEYDPVVIDMCLDKIENSATRLNDIILDFIKIMQVRDRTPEVSLIDFPKITDNIVQSLKYSTGQDYVDFSVSIDPDISFHCDESLLDSILYNLVANAVNYRKSRAGENSFVHIQLRSFANGILMKVSDNGIGMKKEIQGKIFDLFFREANDSKGSGLGLYILKNAVTKLNGRVELESEIDKGTTFSVYLPDLKPAATASEKKEFPLFSLVC
ncbi:MAG TPA: ATP-binding protein, partial [Bacteroidia bacterium]|nr:ATP-binding protein [Bacteroidia bacterium]